MNGSSVQEKFLGQRRLPGVRVTDDGERAPRADRVRQLAFEFERQTELPRFGEYYAPRARPRWIRPSATLANLIVMPAPKECES